MNNEVLNDEFLKSIDSNYEFSNKPIRRLKKSQQPGEIKLQLENLKKQIAEIDACDLKNHANQLVFSDGNFRSKIMLVGEGPGQKEDEIGKPFMGDAGKLLNKMLKAIQLDRNKTYITNVVNFRPPENRKPDPSEIQRYKYFLMEHISIIEPKILVLMGSTAMEALFGSKMKITKERGAWKELIIKNRTYKTIITFHPAYLLRQPEQKKLAWIDLKLIREKMKQLNF